MTDDLEKRLRDAHEIEFADERLRLMLRAADRISHLEAENRAMETILNACTEGTEWTYAQVPDELARLRAENEALRVAGGVAAVYLEEFANAGNQHATKDLKKLRAALKGAAK